MFGGTQKPGQLNSMLSIHPAAHGQEASQLFPDVDIDFAAMMRGDLSNI